MLDNKTLDRYQKLAEETQEQAERMGWGGIFVPFSAHDAIALIEEVRSYRTRPTVAAMGQLMERRLLVHDVERGSQGWRGMHPVALEHDMLGNILGLRNALQEYPLDTYLIGRKTANIANYAMMIADVCGALPSVDRNPPPSFDAVIDSMLTWSTKTFPNSNVNSTMMHFKREVDEFKAALAAGDTANIREELANLFHLLVQLSRVLGVDLRSEVWAKYSANRRRTWQEADEHGVVEHVREEAV